MEKFYTKAVQALIWFIYIMIIITVVGNLVSTPDDVSLSLGIFLLVVAIVLLKPINLFMNRFFK